MAKKGLTRDLIIDTALRLVEERGPMGLSMRELADALDVKAASLYNHIAGMDDLMGQVGLRAAEMRSYAQLGAIAGKTRKEALFALAEAYHDFAMAHENLDKVIMGLQKHQHPELLQAGELTVKPILQVLDGYGLSDDEKIHWQRVLRAAMHGFCVHEHIGGFSHVDLPVRDSYRLAIQAIHDGMVQAESS